MVLNKLAFSYWSYRVILSIPDLVIMVVLDDINYFWYFHTGRTRRYWISWYFHTDRTDGTEYFAFSNWSCWAILSISGILKVVVLDGTEYCGIFIPVVLGGPKYFGIFILLDRTKYFWHFHTVRTGRCWIFWHFHTTGRYRVFFAFSYRSYWTVLNFWHFHSGRTGRYWIFWYFITGRTGRF